MIPFILFSALDPYTYKVYIGKVQSHIKSRSLALTLPNSGNIVDLCEEHLLYNSYCYLNIF
jgi:hypothetical protein